MMIESIDHLILTLMEHMITKKKIDEMEAMFDRLYDALPDVPDQACLLTDRELGILEVLAWVIGDGDKPELD